MEDGQSANFRDSSPSDVHVVQTLTFSLGELNLNFLFFLFIVE